MSEAARQNAFWSYKPGYKLTPEESDAFDYGWRSAMRFMAQPRIPAPSIAPAKITEHSAHQPPRVSVPVAFGLLDWAESILCNAKPMDHCSQEEWDGIIKSWRDQKHGIEKPPKPCLHPTDPLQRQYYVPTPAINWSKEEMEILRLAAEAGNQKPKEHNPHGLVAFYTDAP